MRRSLSPIGMLAAVGLAWVAAPAAAQLTNPNNNPSGGGGAASKSEEYLAHWCVTTWASKTRGIDLQARIDLSNSTIQRDTVIFYQYHGKYPYGGPQLSDNPEWMNQHLAKWRQDVQALIPDPNWTGYAVIDYEEWHPIWERTPNSPSNGAADAHDKDFQTDWEEYLVARKPQVLRGLTGAARVRALKSTYEAAARDYLMRTYREGKRLRPHAKWGFYGLPTREVYVNWAPRVDPWRRMNDEMAWMWREVDVMMPSIYQLMVVVEDRLPQRNTREFTPAQNAEYYRKNIEESKRLAPGKPVIPFIHFRYHPSLGNLGGRWITELAMRQMIEVPKSAGANGVFIWDCIESEQQFRELNDLVQRKVIGWIDPIAVFPQSGSPQANVPPGR